ncbi:hypothetical protein roselon_03477 [Roseibacterium elongatum DSM 19469]|uniref:Uncharacterized protein n=1 Tax=Roseicyclus elongatus DSM 19469 TaxID=1294273 RepID=W8S660_9RHOB|nr:hypothetical protein [Roseibacterium elongatum]AHM05732.1 hypothetical protein roselon_03477 [Roseibacterium elongatum DSM 19469]
MIRLVPILALVAAPSVAAAFPANGTYHSACAEGGAPAEDAAEATLEFPELCFDGACCALYNPTRLRGLEEEFLYDGTCREDDAEFEARLYFGEGPVAGSMVVVLRGLGMTLYDCAAQSGDATEAAAPADDADTPEEDPAAPEEESE